ncbi:MAG TPA: DUF5665 domain-containing protein [Candidatus Andersenbacteria bacterium]|nr:DUF5665 domain-containing protein [Candidatus Andersenbacteria bacterium]
MDQKQDMPEIQAATEQLKKLNQSLRWHNTFIRGIFSGFGTAIGAGLLVALAAVIIGKLTGLPVLGQLFSFLAGHLTTVK